MDRKLDQSHPKVITTFYIYMFSAIFVQGAIGCSLCMYVSFMYMCVFRGVCGCCGSELESIQLTAEEYQQLKDRVMTDIIQGRDVFTKTTPEVHTRTHTSTPISRVSIGP